jgi:hypothetical protein
LEMQIPNSGRPGSEKSFSRALNHGISTHPPHWRWFIRKSETTESPPGAFQLGILLVLQQRCIITGDRLDSRNPK